MPTKQIAVIKVSTAIAGIVALVVIVGGAVGGTMTFADQKFQIAANATAIETNKAASDKEFQAQAKATEALVSVVKDLVSVTQDLRVAVEGIKAQQPHRGSDGQ